ncbi:MAG TPA: InlB B-repeat-containing protein [Methanocorpusculum sp.]|nr:InlB B-repeat-containing protein [Methanocorpusculum sp.]
MNLKITQNNDNQGLFGYVMNGNLSNLVISNVNITGSKKVGSLAGVIYHTDKNEHYITNCKVNGKVIGSGEKVGGLTGTIDARTSRDMNVSLCSVNVSVTGTSLTGGLTGHCEAHIPTESKIPTNISISNCNIIGDVNGSENVGSISGKTYADGKCHIKITNCLVVSNVNGIKNVGGIVGHLNKNGDGIAEISHSIILSQYVNITTSSNVGRIVGLNQGTLSNNYAWKGMTNYSNLFTSETDTNKKNGTDAVSVQVWANKSFYQTLDWDFENTWEIVSADNGNCYPLPYLKTLGRDDSLREKVIHLRPNYIVTFNNTTGYGTMPDQIFVSGDLQELSPNNFTKDGYVFAGWNNTSVEGTYVNFKNEESITIDKDTTLYAVWAPTYTVTFNGNE